MSSQELNFCIHHIFDRNMCPSYSGTVMYLAHLYDTDRGTYNYNKKGAQFILVFFSRLLTKCLFLYNF